MSSNQQQQLQASPNQPAGKVKIIAGYALQQRLGSGSFATVYKGVKVSSPSTATSTTDGGDSQSEGAAASTVAIKAITRMSEKLTKKVLENLELEISILRTYRHPNIVCLHNVQKTDRHFYLILEYCGGGDVQRLIRTRKAGRLSERLCRRLMRDLSAGLKFLWTQELIHRDIKPQNLLLTGPLPLDEMNDPAKMEVHDEMRRQENFPSCQFALKIADFGFARHLQTTSLAETLCGSPLYMAPEILQHQRYDAKADLWSVGTVLFEMIAGKPPFNGENHIDLLRNIQRKAVRLPNGVVVSKEGVNLLRILLNRNPLSRAGFKEFIVACDAFVALGCEGAVPTEDAGSAAQPLMKMDLGTIHEDSGQQHATAASMMTVATEAPPPTSRAAPTTTQQGFMTPPSGPMPTPPNMVSPPTDYRLATTAPTDYRLATRQQTTTNPKFAPLQPSPPQSLATYPPSKVDAPVVPVLMGTNSTALGQIQLTTFQQQTSVSQSTEDGEFVMVERESSSPAASSSTRRMGMLSTSPGTGGMLVGLMGMARPRTILQGGAHQLFDAQAANKMISTAEDVGRRAISVAHLGDTRAYMAMRCLVGMGNSSSSVLSSTMEGVEEEDDDDEHSSANVTDEGGGSRKRVSFTDNSMTDANKEEDEEEMPFALEPKKEESFEPIPSRASGTESSMYRKSTIVPCKAGPKVSQQTVRLHFGEALSCYLKALSMIKSVLGAVHKVKKDVDAVKSTHLSADKANRTDYLLKRCDTTTAWLSGQFNGVLERADAANREITKLPVVVASLPVTNVKELIYNHALACGRDAAVKQLLGQFDAARSCYRTSGLLAETLLMEPNVGVEDRKILEGYVDGYAARITELDSILRHNSSGVIGIIGGIPPTGFDSVLPPILPTTS